MKNLITCVFMFWVILFNAQNKQVLYGLKEVPQSMMLNPGSIINYDYHFGIPFFSGLSFNANISGITVADLFRDDGFGGFNGTDFNTKLDNAVNKFI